MRDIAKQEGLVVEYSGFELNSPSVEVTASLKNTRDTCTWEITPLESGLVGHMICIQLPSWSHDIYTKCTFDGHMAFIIISAIYINHYFDHMAGITPSAFL